MTVKLSENLEVNSPKSVKLGLAPPLYKDLQFKSTNQIVSSSIIKNHVNCDPNDGLLSELLDEVKLSKRS